jgi:TatD DNase family protein
VSGGIAHAFNGSDVQAQAFIARGFKLGFGGALTFDTARQLRRLAATLPLDALVLETDAPDIPPQWLYTPAAQRAAGVPQGRNAPAELPRIGAVLAQLRGMDPGALARATCANARRALPRLAALDEKSDADA